MEFLVVFWKIFSISARSKYSTEMPVNSWRLLCSILHFYSNEAFQLCNCLKLRQIFWRANNADQVNQSHQSSCIDVRVIPSFCTRIFPPFYSLIFVIPHFRLLLKWINLGQFINYSHFSFASYLCTKKINSEEEILYFCLSITVVLNYFVCQIRFELIEYWRVNLSVDQRD